jgi:hypothetical protein
VTEGQRWVIPAEHVDEPDSVLEGWSAADLDEAELVDDQFIEEDEDSWVLDGPVEDFEPQDSNFDDDERPVTATRGQLSWEALVYIAKRTGVDNWVGKDYNGNTVRGRVVAAPSSWRGRKGSMGTVVGCTRHHTGTPETFSAAADYPTYNVVKEGRSGLDNSLSAYGLGRWHSIYAFSEFLSWHAGSWSFAGITDGNGHFLGIEAEGAGGRWTPFQNEFYPRLVASILLYVGEGIAMAPRHADGAMPRGRKSDAANLPSNFMTKVAGYMANPSTLAYGGTSTPTPSPVTSQEDEDDIMYISNPAGAVVQLTPMWARVIDPTTWKGVQAAGHKAVAYSDADFQEVLAAANGVYNTLRHLDGVLGDHAASVKAALEAQAPPSTA